MRGIACAGLDFDPGGVRGIWGDQIKVRGIRSRCAGSAPRRARDYMRGTGFPGFRRARDFPSVPRTCARDEDTMGVMSQIVRIQKANKQSYVAFFDQSVK